MNIIEKSLAIALEAHTGQVDKASRPYILHPIRVMSKMNNEIEMSVAILHDVIEDSSLTLEMLKDKGISKEAIEALQHLTKKPNEPYDDFIERVMKNELAVKVKIEDIKDNMNMSRLKTITEKDIQRVHKYHRALRKLLRR
jgi:(p)ppGpp synthase/HD superfamily hydrolase